MLRIVVTSLVALAIAASCLPAFAGQDGNEPAKVALVDGINFTLSGIPMTVHERERFFGGFRTALDKRGWASADPVADETCKGIADCLSVVARLARADHVLRLKGEGNVKYGYTLELELYSPTSAQTQRSTAFCDICNTDRMAGIAADVAASLLATATKDEQAKKLRQAAPLKVASARSSDLPSNVAKQQSAEPRTGARLGWIPWTLAAVGVAGIAYGTWALVEDGKSTGTPYSPSPPSYVHDTYSSRSVGLAAVIGGSALVATGIVWVVLRPSKSTAISASPTRVALTVRY